MVNLLSEDNNSIAVQSIMHFIILKKKIVLYTSSIWVQLSYHLRRCCEVLPEITWPEETLAGSMFCACATGSCVISAVIWPFHRKWCQSRDGRGPVRWSCAYAQPEVAQPFPAFFSYSSSSTSTMATGSWLQEVRIFRHFPVLFS